jgi:hypothetical protein
MIWVAGSPLTDHEESNNPFLPKTKINPRAYCSDGFEASLNGIISVANNPSGTRGPDWFLTLELIILVTGLPVVILLSWIFDLTSEGLRKTLQMFLRKGQRKCMPMEKFVFQKIPSPD